MGQVTPRSPAKSKIWQAQNRKIWAMAHECGVAEVNVRDIVEGITGDRSISGLTTRQQAEVIAALETVKGQTVRRKRAQKKRIDAEPERGGGATTRQIVEIRRLSESIDWGLPALRAWLSRLYRCEREEWLTASMATKVITGLRAMAKQKADKAARSR